MDDAKIVAALIGFVGAALGALISIRLFYGKRAQELEDRVLSRIEKLEVERRAEHRERFNVFRLYADPLHDAVRSLRFRLEEVLSGEGRAVYLLHDTPNTPYVRYKFTSTIYRLGAVLGWIRGFRRERSYLDPSADSTEKGFEALIEELEKQLADGPEVEETRLNELEKALVKGNPTTLSQKERRLLGVQLENLLKQHLGKHQAISVVDLESTDQRTAAVEIASLLSKGLAVEIPEGLVDARLTEVVALLSIAQAWIYRDWQQAIGDLMIVDAPSAARRFDVMGYRDFLLAMDRAYSGKTHPDLAWYKSLESIFSGLDVSKQGVFDARRKQVKSVYDVVRQLDIELRAMSDRFRSQ